MITKELCNKEKLRELYWQTRHDIIKGEYTEVNALDEEVMELLSEYGSSLYAFCFYLTGDQYEAEDLYQDTFVVALEKREKLEKMICENSENQSEGRKVRNYLMAVASNLWKNRWRKKKRHEKISDENFRNHLDEAARYEEESPENLILKKEKEEMIRSYRISEMKNRKWVTMAAALIILFLLSVTLSQVPQVQAMAKEIRTRFTSLIQFDTQGEKVEYSIHSEYASVSNMPDQSCRYDSLDQLEQEMGILLLRAQNEFTADQSIEYTPYISQDGTLNGFMLIDHGYLTGDLKNVKYGNFDETNWITYEKGQEYCSPISVQITVRTDKNSGVDYNNHELEYAGRILDLTESGVSDVNVVEVEQLNTNAIIATVVTDGPECWRCQSDYQTTEATYAFLVYKGIEYMYIGDVSQETMKQVLYGLEEK